MGFKNLRKLRDENRFTQEEVAAALHVAPNTYSQYETGEIILTESTLIKLAEFYHTSVDFLLDLTEFRSFPYL